MAITEDAEQASNNIYNLKKSFLFSPTLSSANRELMISFMNFGSVFKKKTLKR